MSIVLIHCVTHTHTHTHTHAHTHTHTQVPTWLLNEVALAQVDQPLPSRDSLTSIQLPPSTDKIAESAPQPPPARAFAATPGHETRHMIKLPRGDSPLTKQSDHVINVGDSPLTSGSSAPTSPTSPPIISNDIPALRKISAPKVKVEPIRIPKRLSSASSISHIPQNNHSNRINEPRLTNVKTNPLHLRKSHSNVDVASKARVVTKQQSSLTKLRTSAGRSTTSASAKPRTVNQNTKFRKISVDEKSTQSETVSNQKPGSSKPSMEATKNEKPPDKNDETPPTSPLRGSHDHLSSSSDGEV